MRIGAPDIPNLRIAEEKQRPVIQNLIRGFTLNLDDGSLQGNAGGAIPTCSGQTAVWGNRGRPALLVQYNKNFAPAPGVNSFLVK